jgi:filamentous hemagglutinin family protein
MDVYEERAGDGNNGIVGHKYPLGSKCHNNVIFKFLAFTYIRAHVDYSNMNAIIFPIRSRYLAAAALAFGMMASPVLANPGGGTVKQGNATFSSSGPQFTIQTSDKAQINWQSFNIGSGETTTFLQPSSSSVIWNQINDSNPSQILGTLNANGYVVLQNQAGFFIGGQAVLNAHGLIMTTAPIPVPDLSSGGAWQFNAPPPSASIINYGQINVSGGGPVFLIAHDIENHGTISAPQGNIGLYAGKQVLVSERPDGRGLSASVTLPQGSVDNSGNLIADAGTIAMHAQVVNQGGMVQANSVRQVNGMIELVASDSVNLKSGSTISAQGDATATSASSGGIVIVKAGNAFADASGSTINVAGQAGGRDGLVEIFGNGITKSTIQSQINNHSAADFLSAGGLLLINPMDLVLSLNASSPSAANPNLNVNDLASFSKVSLYAAGNIRLSKTWTLLNSSDSDSSLSLTAGNSISLSDGSAIVAGQNWRVNLAAGPDGLLAKPASGDGIYLNGNSYIQTQNGSIDLWAANEVIVNPGAPYAGNTGVAGNNGIRTRNGGSIDVTAQFGDVNTGGNINGYLFGQSAAPYYKVSTTLGGISTAAGGDVTIAAGGNVTSFLPVQSDYNSAKYDGGTGAFGSQPGNVTITAGGNVSGHYVLANGVGSITAGGNVGAPTSSGGFALSLVKGSWDVSAPNGSIYVQDVRNPSGIFNDKGGSASTYAGYHFFDYDPLASLTLEAGNSVQITGAGAPHGIPSSPGNSVPMLFPPSLSINAGAGGIVLDTDVILFPSPSGEMRLNTSHGGDFMSYQDPNDLTTENIYTLSMSDSAATHWAPSQNISVFGLDDHAATPPELNNPNPVQINIDGSIKNVTVRTTKATQVTVAGDMFNASVLGENLKPTDVTSINVGGKISYSSSYAFTQLSQGILGADPLMPTAWDAIFSFMVDPTLSLQVPSQVMLMTPAQQTAYVYSHLRLVLRDGYQLQPGYDPNANPGFIYDAATKQLGFLYQMKQNVLSALDKTQISILELDSQGNVVIQRHTDGNFYFAATTASFVAPSRLEDLFSQSQSSVRDSQSVCPGFQIGGPGQFKLNAASMDLGSSGGIISWGIGSAYNPVDYSSLAPWTTAGASVQVDVTGDLSLLTSTIASIYGGNVTVNSEGAIYLSQGDFALIPPGTSVSYGIFTSGHSDVSVTAVGNINVGGARIATFNGGDVFVRSEQGTVNAGNGANSILVVPVIRLDPTTGLLTSDTIANPRPFGSGIMAISPTAPYQTSGSSGLPGNITVETPHGDIVSTLGGIQQFALNGSVAGGPTINLTAGTAPADGLPGYAGNVDVGSGGIIGGTINITAQGSVNGLIVSRQDANINAAQSFSGTLLSGGSANVTATAGSVSGTVIGIGGVAASGGSGVNASVMGNNVSIGGAAAASTFAPATASSAATGAAAQANDDASKQLAGNTIDSTQADEEKKKQAKGPVLSKRVGRVTVILPPA